MTGLVISIVVLLGLVSAANGSALSPRHVTVHIAQAATAPNQTLRQYQIGKYKLKVPHQPDSKNLVTIELSAPEVSRQRLTGDPRDNITLFLHFLDEPGPGFTRWEKRLNLVSSELVAPPRYRGDLRLWELPLLRDSRPFMYLSSPGRQFPNQGSHATLIDCASPPMGSRFGEDFLCTVFFKVKPDVYARYRFWHKWIGEWHEIHGRIGAFVDDLFVN